MTVGTRFLHLVGVSHLAFDVSSNDNPRQLQELLVLGKGVHSPAPVTSMVFMKERGEAASVL